MKYSDLIEFEPVDSVIQLQEADDASAAKRLVETYVISDGMADRLIGHVFEQLQLDRAGDSKGLLVVGNYGTGKSHLMALVSAIAEHTDLGLAATHAAVRSGAQTVAGRFEVMRLEIGATEMSLRDLVCDFMDRELERLGVEYQFPSAGEVPNNKGPFEAMMAAFEDIRPGMGLLLVVDELLDYLRTRRENALILDLNFLRELGEICKSTRFRFIAGVQESLFDSGRFQFAAESLRRVRDRFDQVRIDRRDIEHVVSERLLRKSPGQRGQVREHLEQFAPLYGSMSERMETFVGLYPVHPAYVRTFERIHVAEKREILKTLSTAISELSEHRVPTDEPGVIAYDSYWFKLKEDPSFRSIPEIREVIDKSDVLESKIEHSLKPPQYRALAMRVIHALSVHRLTTSDIYVPLGVTSEELRDDLCLTLKMPERNAEFLKTLIDKVLKDIHRTVNGQFITENRENGQYYLDLKKDVDFDALIGAKASSLSEEELDRHYFSALARLLEASDETHVPDYQIWEHELEWREHRAERSGYLFFGAPNERSTAQPPRDFYLYFTQPHVQPHYKDSKRPDEVFFTLKHRDKNFDNYLALYAGAKSLTAMASGENKRVYENKAEEHLAQLTQWLHKHLETGYQVTCEGRSKTLQELVGTGINGEGGQVAARDLANMAGSIALAPHFENRSPEYPVFTVLITRANRDQAVGEALRCIAGGARSKQGTAVLKALELLDDADKLSPRRSRFAKHVLELLDAKQGMVLNRDELVQEEAGIDYWTKFRLEPEFLAVVLAALIHTGASVVKLSHRRLDAGDISELSRIPVSELANFKHVEKPKGFPLERLKQLFGMLGLPEGLLPSESKREQAVKALQLEVSSRLERTVRVQGSLREGLVFWGSPVLSDYEQADWTLQMDRTKQFLESLQVFDTVGKLNNFRYTPEGLDAERVGLARLREVERLVGLIGRTSDLTGYLSTAEAVLPQDHEWPKLARTKRDESLAEIRKPARRGSGELLVKLPRDLKDLKSKYQDVYLELHRRAHLNAQDDQKKAALIIDYRLAQLRTLDKVDIMPHHELESFSNELLGLRTCFALSRRGLEANPICPHTHYRPADDAQFSRSASQILADLDGLLDLTVQRWTATLLENLKDPIVTANIELLSNPVGKSELAAFLKTRTLPEQISSDFVEVVQEVLTGLEKVSVDGGGICRALAEGGVPCTVDELKRRFADYLTELSKDKDPSKVRVMVK